MAFSSPSFPPQADPAAAADPWAWRPAAAALIEEPVSLLRLEGSDSLRFLHGQTSQDLERARPGQWRSTCCITPTARMRALAEVLVDEAGAWLAITAGDGAAVRRALDRVLFPADRVRLGELRQGRLLQRLNGDATNATDTWTPLEGQPGWWLGNTMLLLPDDAPVPVSLAGRQPLSPPELERWRIRQGRPAAPGEINEETNPFELGLADRVSLTKGCYVGQETLARLATYDGVRQQLRRWSATARAPGNAALAPGTPLRDPAGERAGRITSSLPLEDGSSWIGLALVRRAWLEATTLCAGDGEEAVNLSISLPVEFRAPPVGAGGGGPAGQGPGTSREGSG
jgi:folate-binding protein YgfZ